MQSQDSVHYSATVPTPQTLSALSRNTWMLVAGALVGLLVGLAASIRTPPLYRSHVTFHGAVKELQDHAAAITKGAFSERVEQRLAMNSPDRTAEAQDDFSKVMRRIHRVGRPAPVYSSLARDAARDVTASVSEPSRSLDVACVSQEAQLARESCDAVSALIMQQAAPAVSPEDHEKGNKLNLAVANVQHQIDAWKQQLHDPALVNANSSAAELPASLVTVRQAIVQSEMDRLKLGEDGADTVLTGDAKHRMDLLRLSYQGALARSSPEARSAGEAALLQQEIDAATTYAADLSQRISTNASFEPVSFTVSQAATQPVYVGVPQRMLKAAIGAAVGLLLGVLLAFYIDRHPRYLRSPGDITRFLTVPELGVIPHDHEAVGAYRDAALSILAEDWGKGVRTYVLMSADPGDGRTTVASRLGMAFAELKLRVALVDADLRNAQLHTQFSLENKLGLRNLLSGEVDARSAPIDSFTQATSQPDLRVLSAGTGAEPPSSLLHTVHWTALTERLRQEFDLVVIDSTSLFEADDVRRLASQGGAAVLVARAGRTRLSHLTAALQQHSLEGVHVTGALLNGCEAS